MMLVLSALWTVLTRSLLRSAIALAFTSALLAMIIFRLNSPIAGIFELSVCSGLISVVFISAISLTHPLSWEEIFKHMRERRARFILLPFIIIFIGIILSMLNFKINPPQVMAVQENDARYILWNLRQLDLFGQMAILLAGVFGVIILFKERIKK